MTKESHQLIISNEKIYIDLFLSDRTNPIIIFVPGAGGKSKGDYVNIYLDIAESFCHSNFNTILFSPRGQTPSTGYYTFKNTVQDIVHILDYLPTFELSSGQIGLFGRSAGSIISMLTQSMDKRVKSVAIWGTPTNLFKRHYKNIETRQPMFENLRSSGTNIVDDLFLKDLFNAEDVVANVSAPLMIGWGTLDLKYSNLEEQIRLYKDAYKTPLKQLNILENCGHKIDKKLKEYSYYSDIFIKWFLLTL